MGACMQQGQGTAAPLLPYRAVLLLLPHYTTTVGATLGATLGAAASMLPTILLSRALHCIAVAVGAFHPYTVVHHFTRAILS
jgi:hypothetical protein